MDKTIETALRALIEMNLDETNERIADAADDDDDDTPQVTAIRTFAEGGVLTRDAGLELQLSDGGRVYVTIQVQ